MWEEGDQIDLVDCVCVLVLLGLKFETFSTSHPIRVRQLWLSYVYVSYAQNV